MPEIAEVRTVARTLNKQLVGKTIKSVDIPYTKIIVGNPEAFQEKLKNRTFTKIDNYGKWLFLELGDLTILSHLRMEGKYFIKKREEEIAKHEHVIIHLDNGDDLRYHDTRKFGRMQLVNTKDIWQTDEIKKLGYEPDSDQLTASYLYQKLHSKKLPIKSLLLDQTIINGLGNIYVDEVLFAAHIHPERHGETITLAECEGICSSAKKIITKATAMGGTTIRSYTSSLGVYGTYQSELKVHTKEECPCPLCASKILKCRVGGRGTYYCPHCQK